MSDTLVMQDENDMSESNDDSDDNDECSWKDDDFLSLGGGAKPDPPNSNNKASSSSIKNGNGQNSSSNNNNNSFELATSSYGPIGSARGGGGSRISGGVGGESLPPWMKQYTDYRRINPLLALHNEIVGFCNLMSPLEEEMQQKKQIVDRFKELVTQIFDDCEVVVFGSQATGLCLPTSDIDIVIVLPDDVDNDGTGKKAGAEKSSQKKNDETNNDKKRGKSNNHEKNGKKKIINNNNDKISKENIQKSNTKMEKDDGGKETKVDESWEKLTERPPLEKLAQALRDNWLEELSYLEVIGNTRVPLVKFSHKPTGISVDVSFNVNTGPKAAMLIKTYMDAMPPLRPLTILLKYFLASRALNEPYTGGVGSFMLQMMIVSFLQHRERDAYNYRRAGLYNLGGLLLDFLELYGNDFNYISTGISVRHDGFYFPKGAKDKKDIFVIPGRPFMLALENPLEPTHDIGKPSFRVQTLQRSFSVAHKILLAYLATPVLPCLSILSQILPTTQEMSIRSLLKDGGGGGGEGSRSTNTNTGKQARKRGNYHSNNNNQHERSYDHDTTNNQDNVQSLLDRPLGSRRETNTRGNGSTQRKKKSRTWH